MSQQLGIILMVDVESAIKANRLENNIYWYDNMKAFGSTGLGTSYLVSAIHGTHYFDGSQANEQVLNWLPLGVGSTPPSLPRNYFDNKFDKYKINTVEKMLADEFSEMEAYGFGKSAGGEQEGDNTTGLEPLSKFQHRIKHLLSTTKNDELDNNEFGRETAELNLPLFSITGELIDMNEIDEQYDDDDVGDKPVSAEIRSKLRVINPIITDITGEAVDEQIIFPAAYGSPDMVTDGWYWAASIATSRPGIYAYTMHVRLYDIVWSSNKRLKRVCNTANKVHNNKKILRYKPIDLTCEASINITSDPKINGFTRSGIGTLPIPPLW